METKRVRSDLIETFKIINGKYSINSESFFEFDEGGRRGYWDTCRTMVLH